MRSLVKMVCLIVLITLLFAALASAFDQVGYDTSKQWEPDIDPDLDPDIQDLSDLLPDPTNDTDLLMVSGIGAYRVIDYVGVTYDDGWTGADDMVEFDGGRVDPPQEVHGVETSLEITPLINITGPLAIGVGTTAVYADGIDMTRSPSTGVVRTGDVVSSPYQILCVVPDGDPSTASAVLDPTYLQVPDIGFDLEAMASSIVTDGSAYEQACQIASYLVDEREMSLTGGDLVAFLDGTSSGTPEDFVTAYALLARSIDIPARVSYGFRLDGMGDQVLRANDYTLFGDVLLDGMGWVEVPFTEGEGSDDEPNIIALMYHDVNENGRMDPDDPLIGGGTVIVHHGGSPIASATSEDGTFAFSVNRGQCMIEGIGPEGWVSVSVSGFIREVGEGVTEVEFGMTPEEPIGLVPTVTDITYSEPVVTRDRSFTVQGTVVDDEGDPVTGPIIIVYVSESKVGTERFPIGLTAVLEGHYSVECMIGDAPVLGEQQLIARCMGDATYAPSESDPTIEVYESTELTIDGPSQVIEGGSATFEVSLTEASTGDPVPWADVSIAGHGTLILDGDGNGTFTLPFDDDGTYALSLTYDGDGYLLGTEAVWDIEVFPIEVDVIDGTLTRNTVSSITLDVHAGPLPVANESVGVDIIPDDGTTNTNGVCTLETYVGDVTLGPRTAIVTVKGESHTVNVSYASATSLNVVIEDGDAVATLVDDHGEAVDGQLTFEADGRTADVGADDDGVVCPLSDIGGAELTVTYAGSSEYLASSDSIVMPETSVLGWFQWWYLLPLLAIPAAVLVTRRRRDAPEITVKRNGRPPAYDLRYDGIDDDLPPVWSEGEDVSLIVPDGVASIAIDGVDSMTGGIVPLRIGTGDHELVVRGAKGEVRETLRVVDYREEIVRLYDGAVDGWVGTHDVSRDMSPREIQSRVGGVDLDGMETIVSTFEWADYSEHPITREHYVRMYRALREVGV